MQTPTGVVTVTQACCEPVLQSTAEQWEMHVARSGAAVNFCWHTAHPYEEQIFIGVTAATQANCEPVLQSTVDQWGMRFGLSSASEHWYGVTAQLYELQVS